MDARTRHPERSVRCAVKISLIPILNRLEQKYTNYAEPIYIIDSTVFVSFVTVIAIDIDPKKIQLAKHNATIYKVADRIEFIVGDFFKIAPSLKADVVFLSPPWGGPNYLEQKSTSLRNIVEPHGGKYLFQTSKLISNHIAFYLPRNTNVHEVSAEQFHGE